MNGTPIYDIKPYLAYTDSHPEASGGFAAEVFSHALAVHFPEELLSLLPEQKRAAAIGFLSQDPRPAVQNDPEKIFGVLFAGFEIHFRVMNDELTVLSVKSV